MARARASEARAPGYCAAYAREDRDRTTTDYLTSDLSYTEAPPRSYTDCRHRKQFDNATLEHRLYAHKKLVCVHENASQTRQEKQVQEARRSEARDARSLRSAVRLGGAPGGR